MTDIYILLIPFLAIAGVILKPYKISEYIWACAGAMILLILGFLSPSNVFSALAKGNDVYLFLVGMMLLAEAARI
jgi:arsenical pump membrane protein